MKLTVALIFIGAAFAQEHQHPSPSNQTPPAPLQPLAQQVRQLEDALNFLGQALPAADQQRINSGINST